MDKYFKFSCVTGNVASIADYPDLVKSWSQVVDQELAEHHPDFAAVHVQGVKNDQFATDLTRLISAGAAVNNFDIAVALFDVEKTGLGCLYFARSKEESQVYNAREFKPGQDVSIGALTSDALQAKDSTNACGYATTVWNLRGIDLAFTNLSLFTARDNIDVERDAPVDGSVINALRNAEIRAQQFESIIENSEGVLQKSECVFAGSFNAQIDEEAFLGDYIAQRRGIEKQEADRNGNIKALICHAGDSPLVTVERNRFDLHESHGWLMKCANGRMVRKYDYELQQLAAKHHLREVTVRFPPSRYYGSTRNGQDTVLRQKCCAWGDRILVNGKCFESLTQDSFSTSGLYYNLVGEDIDVGTTKPVALHGYLS